MMSSMTAMMNIKGELDAGLRPLVRNEVVDGTPCGKVVFIFARASTEPDNMVGTTWKLPQKFVADIML